MSKSIVGRFVAISSPTAIETAAALRQRHQITGKLSLDVGKTMIFAAPCARPAAQVLALDREAPVIALRVAQL